MTTLYAFCFDGSQYKPVPLPPLPWGGGGGGGGTGRVAVQEDGTTIVPKARFLNFVDNFDIQSADDGDRADILLANDLGDAFDIDEDTISAVPAAYLTANVIVPPSTTRIMIEASGSILLADPVNPDPAAVAVWLEVDGAAVSGSRRRLSVEPGATAVCGGVHCLGRATVAAGAHVVTLVAQASAGVGATVQWREERSMSVRCWRVK